MATPRRIGRFEIQDLQGRGGMGSVYRARDPEVGREVALELLTRIDDAEDVRRFLREARLLARVDHPGICRVIASVLLDNRSPGLVWLDGRSGEIIHSVTLDPSRNGLQKALWLPFPLDLA